MFSFIFRVIVACLMEDVLGHFWKKNLLGSDFPFSYFLLQSSTSNSKDLMDGIFYQLLKCKLRPVWKGDQQSECHTICKLARRSDNMQTSKEHYYATYRVH